MTPTTLSRCGGASRENPSAGLPAPDAGTF